MNQLSTFVCRTRIYHGLGTAGMAGSEAARIGIKKALLVTDAGVRMAGLLEPVEASLKECGIPYEVFDAVPENAGVATMGRSTFVLNETGANGVIAVGGGSPICTAKGSAIEAANGLSVREMTAEGLGIGEGDWVWVETNMGRIKQKAHMNEGISPRVRPDIPWLVAGMQGARRGGIWLERRRRQSPHR